MALVRIIHFEKDAYFDSVILMLISRDVQQMEGVHDAFVAMGTEMNVSLIEQVGFSSPELEGITANDLMIAVSADTESLALEGIQKAKAMIHEKRNKRQSREDGIYSPVSLDGAIDALPDANLIIISVPGAYAAVEARKALTRGLHVMMFSDNVPLAEESELKKMALERGLLMMGPDCGTAIINGRPLGFANVVRRGGIGIVGASGTGIQELCSNIQRFGGGVSHAVGTGGRDLQFSEVGGITTLMAIEAFAQDTDTRVILVISKPPAADIAGRIMDVLGQLAKPSVVHFVGHRHARVPPGVSVAGTLEEAAWMAVRLELGDCDPQPLDSAQVTESISVRIRSEAGCMTEKQKFLRGLYTGGTLADEALMIFKEGGFTIHSNVQTDPCLLLKDPFHSVEHTIVDLGDDVFTVGRPHPMIDPSLRSERISGEVQDPELAVLLLDFVLGYGAHPDPVGMALPSLLEGRTAAQGRGGHLAIVASLTGTEGDIQNLQEQKKKLEDIGSLVMPSNAQAARAALDIIREVTHNERG